MTKVLIITGSLALPEEESINGILASFRNQWATFRSSESPWLDANVKLDLLEELIFLRRALKRGRHRGASYIETVERFFSSPRNLDVPELGEVSLSTSLASQGMAFEATTIFQLTLNHRLRSRLLSECECIFLSGTYLRDIHEVNIAASLVKRRFNKVVLGGALTGLVHHQWVSSLLVDVLAIGYGELLVPVLVDWIRSGYTELRPPPSGSSRRVGNTILLYSGYPAGNSLDFLPTPDWSIPIQYHRRNFNLALYESVRGCPYRCAFCNYPFLFGDTKFRTRSAEKIAEDWERLAELGFRYVSCLDSLFTIPKRRLIRLCELLIARKVPIKWACFARSDDLAETNICDMLVQAGCERVLMGIESGSQKILDNMNKHSSVDINRYALENCRAAGITTSVSIIVGFPGETEATVTETFEFLKSFPPDLFHIYVFSVRSDQMPVLSESAGAGFNLKIHQESSTGQPYWSHSTMSCVEAVGLARSLKWDLMRQSVALEGAAFYPNSLDLKREDMPALLEFQKDMACSQGITHTLIGLLRHWMRNRLEADVNTKLLN